MDPPPGLEQVQKNINELRASLGDAIANANFQLKDPADVPNLDSANRVMEDLWLEARQREDRRLDREKRHLQIAEGTLTLARDSAKDSKDAVRIAELSLAVSVVVAVIALLAFLGG